MVDKINQLLDIILNIKPFGRNKYGSRILRLSIYPRRGKYMLTQKKMELLDIFHRNFLIGTS
jgi:hypothetical protein